MQEYMRLSNAGQLSPLKAQQLEQKIAKLQKQAKRGLANRKARPKSQVYFHICKYSARIIPTKNKAEVGLLRCDGQALDKECYHMLFKKVGYKYTVRYIPYRFAPLRWLYRIGLGRKNPDYVEGTFNLPNYNKVQ